MASSMLEHDYRQLALLSRKASASSGLTSFIWSSNNAKEGEEIKDSAERVLLLLRNSTSTTATTTTTNERRIDSETMLAPVRLSCQSRRPELVGQALGIVQKLVGMSEEGWCTAADVHTVLGLLQSVEAVYDESVQLKILQTCLVVLQSPRLHPRNAETILSLVSLCFRAMTPRGKGQVVTTASATVRQAVAIVFSYVDVGMIVREGSGEGGASRTSCSTARSGGGRSRAGRTSGWRT